MTDILGTGTNLRPGQAQTGFCTQPDVDRQADGGTAPAGEAGAPGAQVPRPVS